MTPIEKKSKGVRDGDIGVSAEGRSKYDFQPPNFCPSLVCLHFQMVLVRDTRQGSGKRRGVRLQRQETTSRVWYELPCKGKENKGQGVLIEHGVSLLCVGHFIHLLAPSIDRSESCEPVGIICPVLSSTPFSTHSIHQRA